LKLDIFCKGLRIDDSLRENSSLRIFRTRAGLGSGIELIFDKIIRVNAPVREKFAQESPYILTQKDGRIRVVNETLNQFSDFDIEIFTPPAFYEKKTSSGKQMSRIGVMQGSLLSVYVGGICEFWKGNSSRRCRFCTTGINVGKNEEIEKSETDILEVIEEAKKECDITFVHFNSGYNAIRDPKEFIGLIGKIRKNTGLLTGVQFPPFGDLTVYDRLRDAGADHMSFCIEFGSEEYFKKVCPGKYADIGHREYLNAIEYCARIFPAGSVSGEIIAGIESTDETKKIIQRITGLGAFPTICVFRPLEGSDMETERPPSFGTMSEILGFAYVSMIKNNIPVGLAPGINVSIIVTPLESKVFAARDEVGDFLWKKYHLINRIKQIMASFFIKKVRIR